MPGPKTRFHRRLWRLYRRWIEPFFPAALLLRAPGMYLRYWRDWSAYRRLPGSRDFPWEAFPRLLDRTQDTPLDVHYFYQSLWAFRQIRQAAPALHLDVGSLVDFVGYLSTLGPTLFIDIRPPRICVPDLRFVHGSILALPFQDQSIRSLSCLHVAEHIGLGRYGDALNPAGTQQATLELQRVLAKDGDLYFSLPVGKPKLAYNAHRVHAPAQIREYFADLELVNFAGVGDDGLFYPELSLTDFSSANYACGMYHFRKR